MAGRRPCERQPAHALSPAERAELLRVANEPRFAAVPPARIVPMLADEGVYLGSESSMARVLREQGQNSHRGRAKKPRAVRPPTTHVATAPRQVWCWDMTYLPAVVIGVWFHLYLILDLFSRKIIGWEVHATDDSNHAAHLVRRTALAEAIASMLTKPLLHGRQRQHAEGHHGAVDAVLAGRQALVLATSRERRQRLRASPCSVPPSTARSSPPRASPSSTRHAPGRPSLCVGTTTSIVTAASATSRPSSATAGRIKPSWTLGTRCTSRHANAIRRAGRVPPETGR